MEEIKLANTKIKIDRKTKMEYTNPNAEVVIVGVTPGNNQLKNDRKNKTPEEIKKENSFAGENMRRNLIDMLDFIGINKILKIDSCKTIFEEDFNKVECTSLLKDATFEVNEKGEEKPFNEPSKIMKSEELKEEFEKGFLKDCENYKKAKVIVALGRDNEELLKNQQSEGKINENIKIIAIPHPSGANIGRVNAFLGKGKSKSDSSYEWAESAGKKAKREIKEINKK